MGSPARPQLTITDGDIDWAAERARAVDVLSALVRIDTTNPPGNETVAATFLADLFRRDGIEAKVIESASGRGNVIASLPGSEDLPPLLISAHLDVVPADASEWDHAPFGGEVVDGYLWGRGTCDMKYVAANAFVVLSLLHRLGIRLRRRIIFAGVADEEQGGAMGSGFLADHHADEIRAGFCLTEVGGMVTEIGGARVALVMTGHRGFEWVRVTAKGRGGHGSLPNDENAIHMLAASVEHLKGDRLGYHLCGSADRMLGALARAQGGAARLAVQLLRNPLTAAAALKLVPPERRAIMAGALFNTAIPTSVSAGAASSPNLVHSEASATIDGRYLPGVSREAFLQRLTRRLGPGVDVESFRGLPPVEFPADTELMDCIRAAMAERDPDLHVVPYFMLGFTDAPHYQRIGITSYGFVPVILKADEPFAELIHARNERISVEGFGEGLEWFFDVVYRFCV